MELIQNGDSGLKTRNTLNELIAASQSSSDVTATTINLTGMEANTFFPVVVSMSDNVNIRMEIRTIPVSSGNPAWSNYPNGGGFAVNWMAILHPSLQGLGLNARLVLINDYRWTVDEISPIGRIEFDNIGVNHLAYLRGGGIYNIILTGGLTPVLYPQGFTNSAGQTYRPIALALATPITARQTVTYTPYPSSTEQPVPGEYWARHDGVLQQVYQRTFMGTTPNAITMALMTGVYHAEIQNGYIVADSGYRIPVNFVSGSISDVYSNYWTYTVSATGQLTVAEMQGTGIRNRPYSMTFKYTKV